MTSRLKQLLVGMFSMLTVLSCHYVHAQREICNPQSSIKKVSPPLTNMDGIWTLKLIGEEEDFPNLEIISLYEDSRHNIWIGLMIGGVMRYNGQELEHFQIDPLKTHTILDIAEDAQGNIWFASFGGGLVKYDGLCFDIWDEASGSPSNHFMCLHLHSDANLYAGTNGEGVLRITEKGPLKTNWDDSLENAKVWDINGDSSSIQLGLVKEGFVDLLKGESDYKINYRLKDSHELPDGTVRTVYNFNNESWIATNKGLVSSQLGKELIVNEHPELPDQIFCMTASKDELWLGSNFDGLIHYKEGKVEKFGIPEGLSSNRIKSMCLDHEGNLWMGTMGAGIMRLEQKAFRNYYQLSGLPEVARDMHQLPNGEILVAVESGGLYVKDGNQFKKFSTPENIEDLMIYEIEHRKEELVLATDNQGVLILKNDDLVQVDIGKEFGNRALSLAVDSASNIFCGGYNGIYIINELDEFVHLSTDTLRGVEVWDIFVDAKNNVWFGTDNAGLWFVDRESFQLKRLAIPELENASVNHISETSSQELLLSLEDKGFAKYRYNSAPEDGQFTRIALNVEADVYSATELKKKIYLGTNRGVLELDSALNLSHDFGRSEGLKSVQATSGKIELDLNGHIWLPTEKFLLEFDPKGYRSINPKSAVSIEHIGLMSESESDWSAMDTSEAKHQTPSYWSSLMSDYVYFKELKAWSKLPSGLELSHDQNRMVFHFRSHSWSDPKHIFYAYQIEGLDEEWIISGNEPKAEYSRLPYGEHRFLVKSSLNGIDWGEPDSFSFRIAPPLWATPWFRAFMIFCLIGLLFLIYKWRIRQLEREKLVLEGKVAERTAELVVEKDKSEQLLLNILPSETAEELKSKGKANTKYYSSASILFSDFKGFTMLTETISAQQLIETLDEYFKVFDEVAGKFGVEKIKTIGDAYMCASGIPKENSNHAVLLCAFGLEMLKLTDEINTNRKLKNEDPWKIRIGMHTGPVIAGVVGKKKFAYDIWGDSVNTAARMESSGEAGKLNISKETANSVASFFNLTSRGEIAAKNKGHLEMHFVDGLKEEYRLNGCPYTANEKFLKKFCVFDEE